MAGTMFNYLLEEEVQDGNEKALKVDSLILNVESQNVSISIVTQELYNILTPEQVNEIKTIACSELDGPEKHESIISKLSSFGSSVAASVLANIITNPQIWAG